MELQEIYYGVVGAGHIGNYHAQQIINIPNIKLRGIYDISSKQAKGVAAKHQTSISPASHLELGTSNFTSQTSIFIFYMSALLYGIGAGRAGRYRSNSVELEVIR